MTIKNVIDSLLTKVPQPERCLRCDSVIDEDNPSACDVFHLDHTPKGHICADCAGKEPRFRAGVVNKAYRMASGLK